MERIREQRAIAGIDEIAGLQGLAEDPLSYRNAATQEAKIRIALAGARLANVLNKELKQVFG